MYPNQVMKLINLFEGQHVGQKGMMTYIKKNGNQQTTKTPIIIPRVLAALRSFDKEILCFSSMNWYMNPGFLFESLSITFVLGLDFEIVMVVVEVQGLDEFLL